MSDLVGNLEDRFSSMAAHMTLSLEWDVKTQNQPNNKETVLENILGKPCFAFEEMSKSS